MLLTNAIRYCFNQQIQFNYCNITTFLHSFRLELKNFDIEICFFEKLVSFVHSQVIQYRGKNVLCNPNQLHNTHRERTQHFSSATYSTIHRFQQFKGKLFVVNLTKDW